tara:strand:- start:174 stop:308 length:135 start_codon:yes stop_codon:yes gene_type:complete
MKKVFFRIIGESIVALLSPLNLEILHYLFRAVREPARRFIRINV